MHRRKSSSAVESPKPPRLRRSYSIAGTDAQNISPRTSPYCKSMLKPWKKLIKSDLIFEIGIAMAIVFASTALHRPIRDWSLVVNDYGKLEQQRIFDTELIRGFMREQDKSYIEMMGDPLEDHCRAFLQGCRGIGEYSSTPEQVALAGTRRETLEWRFIQWIVTLRWFITIKSVLNLDGLYSFRKCEKPPEAIGIALYGKKYLGRLVPYRPVRYEELVPGQRIWDAQSVFSAGFVAATTKLGLEPSMGPTHSNGASP